MSRARSVIDLKELDFISLTPTEIAALSDEDLDRESEKIDAELEETMKTNPVLRELNVTKEMRAEFSVMLRERIKGKVKSHKYCFAG